jgi:hypothetical protein
MNYLNGWYGTPQNEKENFCLFAVTLSGNAVFIKANKRNITYFPRFN